MQEITTPRIRALLAAALVCGWSWLAAPPDAGAQPSPLISAQELQRIKSDPSLVLLHIGPKDDYDAGHIEGARYLTSRDFSTRDSANNLTLELPSEGDLRARLQGLGIGDRSRVVVVFGGGWGSPATRVLWTLQVAGLGAQSQLLDGGSAAWKRAGFPLTKAVPAPATPGRLTATANRALVVDHAWMQAHVGAPRVRIVDGREPVFFEGPGMKHEGQPDMRAGHLPGAVNIPFNSLVDDDVRLLPADALRSAFRAVGIQPGDTVAAYCHIGQQATTVLLAARILGHPIRLYDGSMNDWDNRKLPLVNPRAPK